MARNQSQFAEYDPAKDFRPRVTSSLLFEFFLETAQAGLEGELPGSGNNQLYRGINLPRQAQSQRFSLAN
jgi:hypothetical protein